MNNFLSDQDKGSGAYTDILQPIVMIVCFALTKLAFYEVFISPFVSPMLHLYIHLYTLSNFLLTGPNTHGPIDT